MVCFWLRTYNRTVIDDTQGKIEVWSIEDDTKPLFEVTFPQPTATDCHLPPARDLLFAWNNGEGAVWDLKSTPPPESRFRLTGQYTQDAFFTSDGQFVVTADDRGIGTYDWANKREHRRITFPGQVRSLALHPDGQHLATANANGTVYILRLPELAEHSQSVK